MLTDKKTRKTVLYNAEIDTISKNKNGTNIRGFHFINCAKKELTMYYF